MQWQSLGIPSEGKFHSAAAKMEVRFKNHAGRHGKFGFVWGDIVVTMDVNPNIQSKFIKKMAIHSSAKASDKKKLVQVVRNVM